MPSQMWKQFDPDSDASLTELVEPVMPVDEPPPDRNEPPQVRNARITRNQKYEDVYFKLFQVFKEHKRKWDRYHEVEAKLRKRSKSTIAPKKKPTLRTFTLYASGSQSLESQRRYRSKPSDSIFNLNTEN